MLQCSNGSRSSVVVVMGGFGSAHQLQDTTEAVVKRLVTREKARGWCGAILARTFMSKLHHGYVHNYTSGQQTRVQHAAGVNM